MRHGTVNWPEVSLGDICEFRYGKSLPETTRSGGAVPVYGSNGVVGGHDVAMTAGPTIVVGRKGSHGEVNFSSSACWPIDTTYYIDATATEADLRWLRHRLLTLGLNKMNKAAAVPGLNREDAYRARLLLPPLDEQRRLAAILDQAEALRAQRRAAIAQLDSLGQAIFVKMFGDPALNPFQWQKRPLGSISSKFSDGPFGSNLKSSHYVPTGVRVVRLQNIGVGEFINEDAAYVSEQHFEALRKHECLPGDVLIGTLGEPNLRACVQPDWLHVSLNKADCVQCRPDPSIATPEFICALLNHPSTERIAQTLMHGQTRVRISMGQLRQLEVPVPPVQMQLEFAARVERLGKVKRLALDSAMELDALFASLQHHAFCGELTRRTSTLEDLQKLEAEAGLEALIFVAKRTAKHDLYVIGKTLYMADKHHLEQHGRLIYGETHEALPMGPVPKAAYDTVKFLRGEQLFSSFDEASARAAIRVEGNRLVPLRDADLAKLGADAVKSLEWAIRYMDGATFEQAKAATHDAAWQRTPPNAAIALEHIIELLPAQARQRHWGL